MTVMMREPSQTGRKLEEALGADFPFQINWTGAIAEHPDFIVLNEKSRTDKLAQLIRLDMQGVSIPEYSLGKTPECTLGRTRFHQQGRDFTRSQEPDFFTKFIPADDEWRLHFMKTPKGNIKLMRSGLKLPKTRNFHPWVRTHRLGWKISYIGGAPKEVVEEGREAIYALELDFGAVDILHQKQGGVWVLEVNTCPGLDTGTLKMYVDNFWSLAEV